MTTRNVKNDNNLEQILQPIIRGKTISKKKGVHKNRRLNHCLKYFKVKLFLLIFFIFMKNQQKFLLVFENSNDSNPENLVPNNELNTS